MEHLCRPRRADSTVRVTYLTGGLSSEEEEEDEEEDDSEGGEGRGVG